MKQTLILGLGNSLRGDDGAGPAVIDLLREMDLPVHVDLLDGGTPGLEIVLHLQGYARAIIIDAAEMGLAPAEWRRFTPETAAIKIGENKLQGTLHSAGLAEALALARALDLLPQNVTIYGIQPADLDWRQGLSEPLQAALPALCDEIAETLVC